MNAEEIKAAREICDKATQGPWEACAGSGQCVCTGIHAYVDMDRPVFIADVKPDYVYEEKLRKPADHRDNLNFIILARTALPAALDEIERLQTLLKAPCHTATSNGNYEILEMFKKLKENDQEGHVFIVPARHVGRSAVINTMINLNNTKLAKQKDELQKENERLQKKIKKMHRDLCIESENKE